MDEFAGADTPGPVGALTPTRAPEPGGTPRVSLPRSTPSPTRPAHHGAGPAPAPRTLLITAGPTHEPIDAVRFIGNRSSGRMGVHLADEAARRGWEVTLLLGPVAIEPGEPGVRVVRFRTCADLEGLLAEHAPRADVIVMAAAVADYRPKVDPKFFGGKFRRTSHELTLTLEPTPDLLAGVASRRRAGQMIVGFALEPREELLASARAKLSRKKIDLVVGNPLETMDSESIEAIVLGDDGSERRTPVEAGRPTMPKSRFASWLLDALEESLATRAGKA